MVIRYWLFFSHQDLLVMTKTWMDCRQSVKPDCRSERERKKNPSHIWIHTNESLSSANWSLVFTNAELFRFHCQTYWFSTEVPNIPRPSCILMLNNNEKVASRVRFITQSERSQYFILSELIETRWSGSIELSMCEGNTPSLLGWGWRAAPGREATRWWFFYKCQPCCWAAASPPKASERVDYGGAARLSVVLSLERRPDSGSTSAPAWIGESLPPTLVKVCRLKLDRKSGLIADGKQVLSARQSGKNVPLRKDDWNFFHGWHFLL